MSQPRNKSWADIARGQQKKPPDLRATKPEAIKHKVQASQVVKQRILDADKRTIILRRVDPEATVESIIKDMVDQAHIISQDQLTPADLLEQVTRDELDRRRYYLTFNTHEQKQKFQETGFRVGKTFIPPTLGDFQGYIQFPPYFLGKQDLQQVMGLYGTILNDRFVEVQGVRTGGWHFELRLHEGTTVPNIIDFDGEPIAIINKSARKLCTWCHNYGHLQRQCQKRRLHRLKQLEAQTYRLEARTELMEADEVATLQTHQETDNSSPSTVLPAHEMEQATSSHQQSSPDETTKVQPTAGMRLQEIITSTIDMSTPLQQQEPPPPPKNEGVQVAPVFYAGEKHPRHCRDSTSSGESEPPLKVVPQQELPSEASFSHQLHPHLPPSPKSATSRINALFQEFSDDHSNQPYEHYVAKRKEFAMQSRREIAAEQYPTQDLNRLSKEEWEAMKEAINTRFHELLISEFPDNHFQMNELYLREKQNAKP